MNCEKCNNPITTKVTGSLCSKCFFESRKKTKEIPKTESIVEPIVEDKPIMVSKSTPEVDYLCSECNERHPIPDNGKDRHCITEHKPSKSKEQPIPGIKYCQSCIERGYGLHPATREWQTNYFICDDCYEPLIQNVINVPEQVMADKVKEIKTQLTVETGPLLNKVYDLLKIPEALRFASSDAVLKHRNDIFYHHATPLVNRDLKEVAAEVEELSIILFQIKIALEPKTDYINKVKHAEREKAQLLGLEKSEKEFTKGPSKVKLTQDQKQAKALGLTLENYLKLVKETKQAKFDNIINR